MQCSVSIAHKEVRHCLYTRGSALSGVGGSGYGEVLRQQRATYLMKSWHVEREILPYNLFAISYYISLLYFMSEEV